MSRQQVDELDRRLGRGARPSADAEVERLAAVAENLRAVSPLALVPRQAFRAELRDRLLSEATELAPARAAAAEAARRRPVTAVSPTTPRHDLRTTPKSTTAEPVRAGGRLRRIVAGVAIAAVLGTGAAAMASTTAVPGDGLYGLKRTVEDVRLRLAGSDATRGAIALDQARERLYEAEDLALAAPGGAAGADTSELRGTLADFATSSDEGISLLLKSYADVGDATALAEVDGFVRESLPLLERLRAETAASLHPVIDTLRSDLEGTRAGLATTVAACGQPCSSLGLLVQPQPVPPDPATAPGGSTVPATSGPATPGAPGASLPSVPNVTVPGGVVVGPADPGGGLLPGNLPLPSASTSVSVPPVEAPVPGAGSVPPATDLVGGAPGSVLSPNPLPAPPPPTLPCVIDPLLGTCP